MTDSYALYIRSKARRARPDGVIVDPSSLHPSLFGHQRDIVAWACRMGRAAVFADTGLGKTRIMLDWARHMMGDGRALILAPLAVADQTIAEAAVMGIDIDRIDVVNYERLHQIDPTAYRAVSLDESSILKSYDGATRTALIEAFSATPYRLACTATPAPNDHTELGNHAEYLGVCKRQEMLAEFFVHDGASSSARGWRLKGHAVGRFWEWVASWAVVVRKPSDLGHDDAMYDLPDLRQRFVVVSVPDEMREAQGTLFVQAAKGLNEQRAVRRATVEDRCRAAVESAVSEDGPCIVWCELNDESALVTHLLGDEAVEVTGSDALDDKRNKQLKKDSAMSRQGIPDYLVVMRKPGDNPEPVTKDPDEFPVTLWQQYASPVWMDIDPSDTLQHTSVREEEDERHICPLQLGVIQRAVRLWSNPGDTVLSPFAGIGSEGVVALDMGRRFVGVELKASYYRQAAANLEGQASQVRMFA